MLARRARAQWPLLAALLAVVAIGATLLGACALLLTRTAGQAIEVVAARAAPDDVKVTAYNVTVRGADAPSVAADTRAVLTDALAPFATTASTRASSVNRSLPRAPEANGAPAETYLSGLDDLSTRAVLADGRWPRPASGRAGPLEAVVLEATARMLGLAPGSRVHLGAELSIDPAPALDVTVVGVARPLPAGGWDRDPLSGAGYDHAFMGQGPQPVHAYGPFLVDLADLYASGSLIGRLEVTAHPDLSHAGRRDLDTVTGNVSGADRRLAAALGDRVRIHRVESPLPRTMDQARVQQRVTAAAVLAVALIGGVLTATALALAGRLTAGMRTGETALLSALGVSPRQLAAAATVEGGAIALLAAALAVPASSALHAGLTHLAPLAGAGLAVPPGANAAQVLAVAAGAVALAAVLVVLAIRRAAPSAERHHRRELLARSGADLLLVGFAAVGLWQLNAQPAGSGARADAVRVAAPALVLAAGAALALRVAPPALRGVDRLARRARGLPFPLAAIEAARRSHAMAAGLLIGLACAAGTFGIALNATWERSQHDQADLSVGTDLAITLAAAPRAGDGAAVRAATGGTVSPAVDRGIAVGQWIGNAGDPPRLVAVDTARAGALLRGRVGGDGWAGVGAALAPPTRVEGLPVPAGAVLTISGTAAGAGPMAVAPRLLMQDATGLRTTCDAEPVPLDGTAREIPDCAPVGGLRLVAVALPFAPAAEPSGGAVAVTLTVPGAAPGSPWTATSAPPPPRQITDPAVTVAGSPAGARLTMTATVQLAGPYAAARTLVATAFPAPETVPVAVSSRFADELNVHKGSPLSLSIGTTPLTVTIADVLPTVPSAPGAAAILADLDTLSRALTASGNLDYPMDAWWVGGPSEAGAAARATGLHLGVVTTRAGEADRLIGSPPRAGLPAALRLLVPAAALLLFAGVVLHVTFDLRLRAVEVARLRGLGMYRREIRAVLFGQHAGVLVPLVVAGTAVGALATWTVAPLMVRSDTGAVPVPAVLPVWPWAAEAALVALLLAGSLLAAAAVVAAQVRRADAAHLRVTS